jgi:hypothetical protein
MSIFSETLSAHIVYMPIFSLDFLTIRNLFLDKESIRTWDQKRISKSKVHI